MRGTKLEAWRIPPIWNDLQGKKFSVPANSSVLPKQQSLFDATLTVLRAIADDVRNGLRETVGVECEFSLENERCSMRLDLPPETDTKLIARAVDLENIEAWCDADNRVHIGIGPWFSTKDVDQTVLCTIKVIHVLLGLHAPGETPPKTFGQKILSSVMDVLKAQKAAQNKTN